MSTGLKSRCFWTASQDITPGRTVQVQSELIPKWYGTILQFERSKLVIDTLLAGRDRDQATINYLKRQNRNLEIRDTILYETIYECIRLDSLNQQKYKQSLSTLNVYKKVTRVSVIAAVVFLTLAVIK